MIKFYVTSKQLCHLLVITSSVTQVNGELNCDITKKGGLAMTANQIDYAKHIEIQMHNRNTERQAANELAETNRHNLASEGEAQRHNVQNEQEAQRHNQADEANATLKIQTEANTASKDRSVRKSIAKKDRTAENKRQARKRANDLKIAKLQSKTSYGTAAIDAQAKRDAANIAGQYNVKSTQMNIDYKKWYDTKSPNSKLLKANAERATKDAEYISKKAYREQLDSVSQRHLNRSIERANDSKSALNDADAALKNKDYENYYLKVEAAQLANDKALSEIRKIELSLGIDFNKAVSDASIKAAGLDPIWWHRMGIYKDLLKDQSEQFDDLLKNVLDTTPKSDGTKKKYKEKGKQHIKNTAKHKKKRSGGGGNF